MPREGRRGTTGGRAGLAFNNVRRELERTALAASLAEDLAVAAEAVLAADTSAGARAERQELTALREALERYRKNTTA